MLTHAKSPLLILASLVIGSIATYSMTPTLTPETLLEIQNKKSVRDCITKISYESGTLEIQTAIGICSKMEVKKITGTVTSANSGVPLGLKLSTQKIHGTTHEQSTKSISQNTQKKNSTALIAEKAVKIGAKKEKPSQSLLTKYMNVKTAEISSDSEKYWTAYETAISQIHKWEGLCLSAYWDHSGYSIGYGSRAKSPTERITKAEADRRLAGLVTQVLGKVQKDFPKLRPEAQGALVSFAYNCHSGYRSILRNGLSYHGQWCKTASGKRYDGLVKRRAEESRLIFSKH